MPTVALSWWTVPVVPAMVFVGGFLRNYRLLSDHNRVLNSRLNECEKTIVELCEERDAVLELLTSSDLLREETESIDLETDVKLAALQTRQWIHGLG